MKVTKNGVKKLSSLKDESYVNRALMSKSSKDLFSNKRLQISQVFGKADSKDKIILDLAHDQNLATQFGELLKPNNFPGPGPKWGWVRDLILKCNSLGLVGAQLHSLGAQLSPLEAGVALSHNPHLSDFERLCAILDITSCKRAQKNLFETYWGKNYEEKIFEVVHFESSSNNYTLPIFFLFMNFLEFFKHTKNEAKVFKGLEPILDPNLDKIWESESAVFCNDAGWELNRVVKYCPENWKLREILRKILFSIHLESKGGNIQTFSAYYKIFGTSLESYSLYYDFGSSKISKIKENHSW